MKFSDPRINYFDSLAANWDNEEPSSEYMTERLSQHADLLKIKSGHKLLEVGCGTGKTSAYLAELISPTRLKAIDFAPEMISRAKNKPIDADFACLDVCSDPLEENFYDIILCFHSFPHFRDQPAALSNFARALKTSGRLIIMHLAGSAHINGFHAKLDGAVGTDILPVGNQWPPLLENAAFKLISLIDREDLFFLDAVKMN